MASIYRFSLVPVAPAWSDPFDATIQHPSRRLGKREESIVADNEESARAKLAHAVADDEAGETIEDVTLLSVSPWIN